MLKIVVPTVIFVPVTTSPISSPSVLLTPVTTAFPLVRVPVKLVGGITREGYPPTN